jgi:hypothetical protein
MYRSSAAWAAQHSKARHSTARHGTARLGAAVGPYEHDHQERVNMPKNTLGK